MSDLQVCSSTLDSTISWRQECAFPTLRIVAIAAAATTATTATTTTTTTTITTTTTTTTTAATTAVAADTAASRIEPTPTIVEFLRVFNQVGCLHRNRIEILPLDLVVRSFVLLMLSASVEGGGGTTRGRR